MKIDASTKPEATQDALRESQGRIQAILDTAVDAIITIDEHGIVESANTGSGTAVRLSARRPDRP